MTDKIDQLAQVVTPEDLRRRGYAPGGYTCKCCYCETEFIGDKRASVCEKCAYTLHVAAASPAPPVEGTADIIPAAREWPKPGDKMRFLDEGGYPSDLARAREHFTKGQIVTVRDFDLGDWHSTIAFEGIPGRFNSVMFEHADDAALTAIGARDE